MIIKVERIMSNDDATLSNIWVDDHCICFGLEDEYRATKLANETRIPAGTYKVGLRREGGFHAKYSVKFPDIHQGMLQIQDVPGFEYILIHVGNTDEDTAGCLLVGEGCISTPNEISIQYSVLAYRRFYTLVAELAKIGALTITFIDRDRP